MQTSGIMHPMSPSCPSTLCRPHFSSESKERDRLAAENKALREEIKQLLAALHVYRDVVICLSARMELREAQPGPPHSPALD
jgi:hypothetical protein